MAPEAAAAAAEAAERARRAATTATAVVSRACWIEVAWYGRCAVMLQSLFRGYWVRCAVEDWHQQSAFIGLHLLQRRWDDVHDAAVVAEAAAATVIQGMVRGATHRGPWRAHWWAINAIARWCQLKHPESRRLWWRRAMAGHLRRELAVCARRVPGKRPNQRARQRCAARKRMLTAELCVAEQAYEELGIALRRGPGAARARAAAATAALAARVAAATGVAWVQEHDYFYHWAYSFHSYHREGQQPPPAAVVPTCAAPASPLFESATEVCSQIAEALLEKAVGLQLDALLRRRRREREQWWSDKLHRLYPVPSAATVRRFLEVEAAERRREELFGKHHTPLPASESPHLEALGH